MTKFSKTMRAEFDTLLHEESCLSEELEAENLRLLKETESSNNQEEPSSASNNAFSHFVYFNDS